MHTDIFVLSCKVLSPVLLATEAAADRTDINSADFVAVVHAPREFIPPSLPRSYNQAMEKVAYSDNVDKLKTLGGLFLATKSG